jgi:hypothetical protein
MAAKMYPLGLEMAMETLLDIETAGGVKFALTTATYNAAHADYADVSASTVGTPIALTSPTISVSGTTLTFDAADTGLTWESVAGGSTLTGVISYYDTTVAGTSALLAFNEFASTVATNGGDITVTIDASGIFTIAMA